MESRRDGETERRRAPKDVVARHCEAERSNPKQSLLEWASTIIPAHYNDHDPILGSVLLEAIPMGIVTSLRSSRRHLRGSFGLLRSATQFLATTPKKKGEQKCSPQNYFQRRSTHLTLLESNHGRNR